MTNKQKVRAIFPFATAKKNVLNPSKYAWSIRLGHRRLSVRNASEEAAWDDARKNIVTAVTIYI